MAERPGWSAWKTFLKKSSVKFVMNSIRRIALVSSVRTGKTLYINAMMHIHEFNQLFGTDFSPESYGTVGGLLLDQLGKVPQKGDSVQIGH
jgi:Mg2+/Co2+ transporter CorC